MKKVLIVCGAGGAIQLEAAAGALKALDESGALEDAEVSYMSCSGGAPVAALHCAGHSGEDIEEIIKTHDMGDLMSRGFFDRYMNPQGIYDLMLEKLPDTPMSNCRVALTLMTEGKDAKAAMADATPVTVIASMSIQGVFQPVQIGEDIYGDGGALNYIPTPAIKDIDNYDHIYFMICPVDTSDPEVFAFFDYELKALLAIADREVIQFHESGWDDLANVTVFEPEIPQEAQDVGLLAELLEWSPNFVMFDSAYEQAKEKLK